MEQRRSTSILWIAVVMIPAPWMLTHTAPCRSAGIVVQHSTGHRSWSSIIVLVIYILFLCLALVPVNTVFVFFCIKRAAICIDCQGRLFWSEVNIPQIEPSTNEDPRSTSKAIILTTRSHAHTHEMKMQKTGAFSLQQQFHHSEYDSVPISLTKPTLYREMIDISYKSNLVGLLYQLVSPQIVYRMTT